MASVRWAWVLTFFMGLGGALSDPPDSVAGPPVGRPLVRHAKGAPVSEPGSTLRVRAVMEEGILVVYDAPRVTDRSANGPAYFCLWRDLSTGELSIYSRLTATPEEIDQALRALGA